MQVPVTYQHLIYGIAIRERQVKARYSIYLEVVTTSILVSYWLEERGHGKDALV